MESPRPGPISQLYRPSLALLTDLYQLTMAYGYWARGLHDREAVFHLIFRENPFGGGFTVAAGLHAAVEYLENLRFDSDDLGYLAEVPDRDGSPLFPRDFLAFLQEFSLACDIDAVAEGTVVFPHEPLVRVKGPLLQAQILETALLNLINFPTLIATKAARVVLAARGEPVLEFGMRRAQGIDGSISASRAAYVGGCAATSNVLAGKLFGIPIKGTHAHSWVMCFDSELEAFEAYAGAMPNNCVFLVDTYDTLQGVHNAVAVGRRLRERGYPLLGIRLDSGDLAYLSIQARKILDAEGFTDTAILASSDLDEHLITSLKEQGAAIAVWGVGTRLATAYDQPALGGVYKLSAIRNRSGQWGDRVKLSELAVKTSTPGILQVRRFRHRGQLIADVIFDEKYPLGSDCVVVDPADPTRRKFVPAGAEGEDLLIPVFRGGRCVDAIPSLDDSRERARRQLAELHPGIKRFANPHQYPAGLEAGLHQRKTDMILHARGFHP